MLKGKKRKKETVAAVTEVQIVGFRVGAELYGIEIHAVQEIDRMHAITKLPKTLPFIEGVMNLRERIVPVIDLSKRFGSEPITPGRQTRVIFARVGGETVGLIVDQVSEVFTLAEGDVEPPPAMAFAIDRKYVKGVGRIEEGLIIILNLELLLSADELLQLQQSSPGAGEAAR